jgi:hypothetical protein
MKRLLESHRYISSDINGEDLTFKFYDDNTLSIYDNENERYLQPKELSKKAYAFYALKRIDYVKKHVLKVNNKELTVKVGT